jgi:hypothetical protein
MSGNVRTLNAAATHHGSATQVDYIVVNSDIISNTSSKTFTYIDDNPMHIDINNDDPCMMDVEGVRDGDSNKDNSNNSRDDIDGQRKRKSVDWLTQYSPPVLLLLSLNKVGINLTIIAYQTHNGRTHKKWIQPLSSVLSSLATSNTTHTVRTPPAYRTSSNGNE